MAALILFALFNFLISEGPVVLNDNNEPKGVHQINSMKDSLLQNLDEMRLVIQNQQFNNCFATDSVFYNSSNQLVLSVGHYGCHKNITYYLSIFDSDNIIYYEQCSKGDGLPFNKRIIYCQNGEPIYGKHTDYKLRWIERSVIDSTSNELSDLQLKATYMELKNNAKELLSLHEIILKSVPDSTGNDKVHLNYNNQKTYDKWTFVLDSDYYDSMNNLAK